MDWASATAGRGNDAGEGGGELIPTKYLLQRPHSVATLMVVMAQVCWRRLHLFFATRAVLAVAFLPGGEISLILCVCVCVCVCACVRACVRSCALRWRRGQPKTQAAQRLLEKLSLAEESQTVNDCYECLDELLYSDAVPGNIIGAELLWTAEAEAGFEREDILSFRRLERLYPELWPDKLRVEEEAREAKQREIEEEEQRRYDAYDCNVMKRCPGGSYGTCQAPWDGFVCGHCPSGYYISGRMFDDCLA